jgi:hypothetical protein
MADGEDTNLDPDEVRQGMHLAVERIRKKFADRTEPQSERALLNEPDKAETER